MGSSVAREGFEDPERIRERAVGPVGHAQEIASMLVANVLFHCRPEQVDGFGVAAFFQQNAGDFGDRLVLYGGGVDCDGLAQCLNGGFVVVRHGGDEAAGGEGVSRSAGLRFFQAREARR